MISIHADLSISRVICTTYSAHKFIMLGPPIKFSNHLYFSTRVLFLKNSQSIIVILNDESDGSNTQPSTR